MENTVYCTAQGSLNLWIFYYRGSQCPLHSISQIVPDSAVVSYHLLGPICRSFSKDAFKGKFCLFFNLARFFLNSMILFFFFLSFYICTCVTSAYGGSQAKGLIGAVAISLHTATAMQDLSHVCNLHRSSRQRLIPNPLSEARD